MSINSETLIKIKQQLHSAQNVTGSVSSDLYNHLTEVFSRIVQYHQYDAYDKFEEISTLVKKTHMNFSDPRRDCDLNASKAGDDSAASERNAWIKQSKDLLNEVSFETTNFCRSTQLSRINSALLNLKLWFPIWTRRPKCSNGPAFHSVKNSTTSFLSPSRYVQVRMIIFRVEIGKLERSQQFALLR